MKKYSRFATAALASAMTFSAMGMAVLATEPSTGEGDTELTPEQKITAILNKTVTKDTKTVLPATEFTFSVSIPEVAENTQIDNIPVFAGSATTDLDVNDPTKPTVDDDNTLATSVTYTPGSVAAVERAFAGKTPGIYRYEVKENIPTTDNAKYEDLTYDSTVYIVDVYVTNVEGSNPATTAATGMKVYKSGQSADPSDESNNVKRSGFVFTNDYTKDTNNDLHKVEISKVITGNQADLNTTEQFEFTITVNGATGEQYYYESSDATDKGYITSGVAKKINFSKDEVVTIYGLSKTDTYTVEETGAGTETTYGSNGYKTTYTTTAYTPSQVESDDTVGKTVVTNTKEGNIPTGILLTAAPYAAVVALGGVFAGLFFRRKRED